MIDPDRLRADWARLTEHPGLDTFAETFYLYLFGRHPDTRGMFPPGMAEQRAHLVTAIGAVVRCVDRLDQVTGRLERLGRDHRRYGAEPAHYTAVGGCLIDALKYHGLGDARELENWAAAYSTVASAMQAAARAETDRGVPAWLDLVPAETRETPGGDLELTFDLPAGLPAEWQPVDGGTWQASAAGEPGMWVELAVWDADPGNERIGPRMWTAHTIDPAEPGSLALLYLPEGASVRLGGPRPPAQEEPV